MLIALLYDEPTYQTYGCSNLGSVRIIATAAYSAKELVLSRAVKKLHVLSHLHKRVSS